MRRPVAVVYFLDGKFRTDHEAKQKLQRCSEIIEDICAQATCLSKSTILAKFAQFATGHETPANIVANAILFCGFRPSENTSLNAILTEAIRIDPPIQRLWRTACREFNVEGIPIPNGAGLLIDLGLASRDEAYVQKADCFRTDREGQKMTSLFFANPDLGCPGRHIGIMVASIRARAIKGVAPNGFSVSDVEWLFPGDVRCINKLFVVKNADAGRSVRHND